MDPPAARLDEPRGLPEATAAVPLLLHTPGPIPPIDDDDDDEEDERGGGRPGGGNIDPDDDEGVDDDDDEEDDEADKQWAWQRSASFRGAGARFVL